MIVNNLSCCSVTHTVSWKCFIWWKELLDNFTLLISTLITWYHQSYLKRQSKRLAIVKMPVIEFLHFDLCSIQWISWNWIYFICRLAKGINENCEAAYKMLQCFKADNLEFWFKWNARSRLSTSKPILDESSLTLSFSAIFFFEQSISIHSS